MPRTADAKKIKKTTAVKKTVKKKTTHKKITVRKKQKKIVTESVLPVAPLPPLPEIFTISPTISHGHSTYEFNSEFTPRRRPRRSLVMVFGVSVIMVLIVVGWIMNLKQFINANVVAAPENNERQADFANLKEELNTTLGEIKGQLNELNEFDETTPIEDSRATQTEDSSASIKDVFKEMAEKEAASTITSTNPPATQSPVLPE